MPIAAGDIIYASDILTPWTAYTATWTGATSNPAINNGVMTAEYRYVGTSVEYRGRIVMGSTTTYGTGEWRISLPVNALSQNHVVGNAFYHDFGTTYFPGVCVAQVGVDRLNFVASASGQVQSTIPFTWAVSDQLIWFVSYPVA